MDSIKTITRFPAQVLSGVAIGIAAGLALMRYLEKFLNTLWIISSDF